MFLVKKSAFEVWEICEISRKIGEIETKEELAGVGFAEKGEIPDFIYWTLAKDRFNVYLVDFTYQNATKIEGIAPFPYQNTTNQRLMQCRDTNILIYGQDLSSKSHFLRRYELTGLQAQSCFIEDMREMEVVDVTCSWEAVVLTADTVRFISNKRKLDMRLSGALGALRRVDARSKGTIIIEAEKGFWTLSENSHLEAYIAGVNPNVTVQYAFSLPLYLQYEQDREGREWAHIQSINEHLFNSVYVPLPATNGLSHIEMWEIDERKSYNLLLMDRDAIRLFIVELATPVLGVRGEEGTVEVCAGRREQQERECVQVTVNVVNSTAIMVKQGMDLHPAAAVTWTWLLTSFNITETIPLSSIVSGANLRYSLPQFPQIPEMSVKMSLTDDQYIESTREHLPLLLRNMEIACAYFTPQFVYIGLIQNQRIIRLALEIDNFFVSEYLAADNSVITECSISQRGILVFLTNTDELYLTTFSFQSVIAGIKHAIWVQDMLIAATDRCVGMINPEQALWVYNITCESGRVERVFGSGEWLVVVREHTLYTFQLNQYDFKRNLAFLLPVDYKEVTYQHPYIVVVTPADLINVYKVSLGPEYLLIKVISLVSHCQFKSLQGNGKILIVNCGTFLQVINLAAPQREAQIGRMEVRKAQAIDCVSDLNVVNLQCDEDNCSISTRKWVPSGFLEVHLKEKSSILPGVINITTALIVESEGERQTIPFTLQLKSIVETPQVRATWRTESLEVPWDQSFSLNLYDVFTGSELNFSSSSPNLHIIPKLLYKGDCSLSLVAQFMAISSNRYLAFHIFNEVLNIYIIAFPACNISSSHRLFPQQFGFHLLFACKILYISPQEDLVFSLTGDISDNIDAATMHTAIFAYNLPSKRLQSVHNEPGLHLLRRYHVIEDGDDVEIWWYQPGLCHMHFKQTSNGITLSKEEFSDPILLDIMSLGSVKQGNTVTIYFVSHDFKVYEADASAHVRLLGEIAASALDVNIQGNRLFLVLSAALRVLSLPQLSTLKVLPLPGITSDLALFHVIRLTSANFVLVEGLVANTILVLDAAAREGCELVARLPIKSHNGYFVHRNMFAVLTFSAWMVYEVENTPMGVIGAGETREIVTLRASNSRGTAEVSFLLIRTGRGRLGLYLGAVLLLGSCCWVCRKKTRSRDGEIEMRQLRTAEIEE